nr:hypothetical protein [Nanoarchaeum sp.]
MKLKKICQNILEDNKDVLVIMLIGSRVRGDFTENSDWDFVFITKRGKSYDLSRKYEEEISKKVDISDYLVQVHLWPLKLFKQKHKEGNSFIYCSLRDSKILASKTKQSFTLPKINKKAAVNRFNLAKGFMSDIKLFAKKKKFYISSFCSMLGYSAMHLLWTVCMLNNFCPISKHTVLKQSKKYFGEEEFKTLKKAYSFYADENLFLHKNVRKKVFLKLFNGLNKIIKRIERRYHIKK